MRDDAESCRVVVCVTVSDQRPPAQALRQLGSDFLTLAFVRSLEFDFTVSTLNHLKSTKPNSTCQEGTEVSSGSWPYS